MFEPNYLACYLKNLLWLLLQMGECICRSFLHVRINLKCELQLYNIDGDDIALCGNTYS